MEDQNFCGKKVRDENLMKRECSEADVKHSSPSMGRSEQILGVLSDDDKSMKVESFSVEIEPTILNLDDKQSLASQEVWGNLESADDFLAQSNDSAYQLWDFWS